jgi:RND family efflux transporter MFP subunit
MSDHNQNKLAAADSSAHAPPHEENPIPTDLPRFGSITIGLMTLVGVVLLGVLFVVGYLPHRHRIADANRIAAEAQDKPVVDVVLPKRVSTAGNLILPGDARAFQETSLYPRANGYLKRLLVDIGDRVKEGQLLAEIDTPELNAQLNEARAAQEQASANLNKAQADLTLSESTLNRYENLSKTPGAVTPQDVDEKRAQFNQAKHAFEAGRASVGASAAAVQRLADLQSFEKITAPFAGVISARNYDVGALLTAGSTGKELFRLVQSDTLRVFINVPQAYATGVKLGQEAGFEVRNLPGRKFAGKVARTSGAVDPSNRTLRVEVQVDNKEGALWAGMYGTVTLPILRDQPPLIVPSSALLFQSQGTQVAVIQDNKVRMKTINVGRDLGQELEVTGGLGESDQVVANPGERLAEGVEVEVARVPAPEQPKTATETAARQ